MADRFAQITGDSAEALMLAKAEMARVVGAQALTSAFNESFQLMAWIFLAALVLVPFCKPPPQFAKPVLADH